MSRPESDTQDLSENLVEEAFRLVLPEGFSVLRDEERINCVSREPAGVLVITSEMVEDPDELPSLSRMLAGFLTQSGHPVATDELLQISSVPGAYGFGWQYSESETYHRFWLFGNKVCWVLLSFLCPLSNQVHFQEPLSALVGSLRLRTDGSDV